MSSTKGAETKSADTKPDNDPERGAKGEGKGLDTAPDSERAATGPEYPNDPHRPDINPPTLKVPPDGFPTPTFAKPDDDGIISTAGPVWEGGDPGVAVQFRSDPDNVDERYWPKEDAEKRAADRRTEFERETDQRNEDQRKAIEKREKEDWKAVERASKKAEDMADDVREKLEARQTPNTGYAGL